MGPVERLALPYMTEVAYDKLTTAQKVFRTLAWDQLFNAAMAYVFSMAPWLNIPFVSYIVKGLANKISNGLFDIFVITIDLQAIKFVNAQHQREFERASSALQAISRTKGIDSDEFNKAREVAKDALAKFVSYSGGNKLRLGKSA